MAISTAIDASAVARVVGIETKFVNLNRTNTVLLPQQIAVVGQGASGSVYSDDPVTVTSAAQAGTLYGFGSPVHLSVERLLPTNGDGVGSIPVTVYPLQNDAVGAAAATAEITPSGAATGDAEIVINVGGVKTRVAIKNGDAVATIVDNIVTAMSSKLDNPVTVADGTTKADLTAKWTGTSTNRIKLTVEEVVGDSGITFTTTAFTGGLVNPTVDSALSRIGSKWETMILNCLDIVDTTALDAYKTFGEGRWGALEHKPCIVFTGNTDSLNLPNITDARKTDRVNSQLVLPDATNLEFVVAARQLARIAKRANNNPAYDYGSLPIDGIDTGSALNHLQRDILIKDGSSTVEVKNGVAHCSDIVTMYHPDGDPTPAYRYVVDIVKLQNIIFNLNLIFNSTAWDGAPLIPDDQPTSNPAAKKPKTAKAAIASMLDGLGLNAIISDPETAKSNTLVEIDSQNPKRLNISLTVQLSGNANIISIDLNFGFYFGTPTVVA